MVFQAVYKSFWICFLLVSFGACAPAKTALKKWQKRGQPDVNYQSGDNLRGGSGSSGAGSFIFGTDSDGKTFLGVGSESNVGSSVAQDAGLSQMIADLLLLSPYGSRPVLQSHWSSPQVPLGMVATRPVYPSSLIIHTDSGYQRARDFRSDSKYTQDTFDNIPHPGIPQIGTKRQQKF